MPQIEAHTAVRDDLI